MLHDNAYGKPDRDTSPSSSSYAKLPTRLSESLEALKGDLELNKSLGDRFVRWFLEVKEHERKAMAEIAHEVNVDKDLPSALHCQQKYLLLL
jgi:glutamine synthetase